MSVQPLLKPAQADWSTDLAKLGPQIADEGRACDAENRYVGANIAALREHGFLGLAVPTELGGGGLSRIELADMLRELARYCSATALVLAMHTHTVAAAAWRWRILVRRLGLSLGWRESVAAYYRSQFLNTVLPGGVVGDVDRAVSHGRSVDQVSDFSWGCHLRATDGWPSGGDDSCVREWHNQLRDGQQCRQVRDHRSIFGRRPSRVRNSTGRCRPDHSQCASR